MIEPRSNSYVMLLEAAPEPGPEGEPVFTDLVTGRCAGVVNPDSAELVLILMVSEGKARTFLCPPNVITHVHHQPDEADDSPAWVATREGIARAMYDAWEKQHSARTQ